MSNVAEFFISFIFGILHFAALGVIAVAFIAFPVAMFFGLIWLLVTFPIIGIVLVFIVIGLFSALMLDGELGGQDNEGT